MHRSQLHRSRIRRGPRANNDAALGHTYAGHVYLFGSKGLLKRALIEHAQPGDASVAVALKQSAPCLCLHWSHAKRLEQRGGSEAGTRGRERAASGEGGGANEPSFDLNTTVAKATPCFAEPIPRVGIVVFLLCRGGGLSSLVFQTKDGSVRRAYANTWRICNPNEQQ